jgi:hypothetical protein
VLRLSLPTLDDALRIDQPLALSLRQALPPLLDGLGVLMQRNGPRAHALAVNRLVAGSNPARGAKTNQRLRLSRISQRLFLDSVWTAEKAVRRRLPLTAVRAASRPGQRTGDARLLAVGLLQRGESGGRSGRHRSRVWQCPPPAASRHPGLSSLAKHLRELLCALGHSSFAISPLFVRVEVCHDHLFTRNYLVSRMGHCRLTSGETPL